MMFGPKHPTRSCLTALLLAALLALPGTAGAADAEPAPGAAPDAAPEDTADAKASGGEATKPSAQGAAAPSGDVFIPTEDISEDFAVAFPVDI